MSIPVTAKVDSLNTIDKCDFRGVAQGGADNQHLLFSYGTVVPNLP